MDEHRDQRLALGAVFARLVVQAVTVRQFSIDEMASILADIGERLAVVHEGLWALRASLRRDGRPEAAVLSEIFVLCLEAAEVAHAVEFGAASSAAARAVGKAMKGDQ